MEDEVLNSHNKLEHRPSHTTEHILNQTMVRLFGCSRAVEAHIEEKKSKMDFKLDAEPTQNQIQQIENMVNSVIAQNLQVTMEFTTQAEAVQMFDLKRLPDGASQTVRIVHVGDFDSCLCIGQHVNNTSEIGMFKITSSSFSDGIWRVRWKLLPR